MTKTRLTIELKFKIWIIQAQIQLQLQKCLKFNSKIFTHIIYYYVLLKI